MKRNLSAAALLAILAAASALTPQTGLCAILDDDTLIYMSGADMTNESTAACAFPVSSAATTAAVSSDTSAAAVHSGRGPSATNSSAISVGASSGWGVAFTATRPGESPYSLGDFTFECIFKLTQTPASGSYLFNHKGGFRLQFKENSVLQFRDGSSWDVRCTSSLAVEEWHHVAVVQNVSDGKMHFYVDYWKVGETPVPKYTDVSTQVSDLACLGCYNIDFASGGMKNVIYDEVRLEKRALSPGEFLTSLPVDADTAYYNSLDKTPSAGYLGDIELPVRAYRVENYTSAAGRFAATNDTAAANVSAASVGGAVRENGGALYMDRLAVSEGSAPNYGGGFILNDTTSSIAASSFTFETFFKVESRLTGTAGYILCYPHVLSIYVDTNDRLRANIAINDSLDGTSVLSSDDNITVVDGRWHHVAAVFDADAETFAIYLDGTAVKTLAGVASIVKSGETPGTKFFVGGSSHNTNQNTLTRSFSQGWLDELRITKRALRPAEFMTADPLGKTVLWGRFENGSAMSSVPSNCLATAAAIAGSASIARGSDARPSRKYYAFDSAEELDNNGGAVLDGGTISYAANGLLDLPVATVEFFVKGQSGSSAARAAALVAGSGTPWTLTADGRLAVSAGGVSGSTALSPSPFDGNWHHVAISYAPSNATTRVVAFVDRQRAAELAVGGAMDFGGGASLVFGSGFSGALDEVRVSQTQLGLEDLEFFGAPDATVMTIR